MGDGGTASRFRRTTALALAALCLIAGGCAPAPADAQSRIVAVATISILADVVAAVGGEHVDARAIVGVGGDPHTYEPVPSDARLVSRADVVFRNGLGLERWLDTLITTVRGEDRVVTVSDGISEIAGGGTHPDPHLWMDPAFTSAYAATIGAALSAIDPAHASEYEAGTRAYQDRLSDLDRQIRARMATVPAERRKLVTSHDAFSYFGQRYGLDVVGSIWGISTEREPSARETARLVDRVRDQGVPVVFIETTINPDLMTAVARDAGVAVGEPLYGDSVGPPGSGADTYIGMMQANSRRIAAGLLGGAP